jgi:acyl dehydratase
MIVEPWTVTAKNLPEHARNAIHTDAGAQAQGFPRALVAGVTTYAYLTHPVVAAFGTEWLERGTAEIRFRSPVFLDDEVVCRPEAIGDDVMISATVGGEVRATLRASQGDGPVAEALLPGDPLRTRRIRLEGEFGAEYGRRAGDDLDLYEGLGIVHPAVWPAFANHLVHTEVANGAWVHTSSAIRHHALAPVGSTAEVSAVVLRRFDSRAGVRAVLDVRIEVEAGLVATITHEAIVDLSRRVDPTLST